MEKINYLESQLAYYKQNYEKAINDKDCTAKILNEKLNILRRQFRSRNIQDMSKSVVLILILIF